MFDQAIWSMIYFASIMKQPYIRPSLVGSAVLQGNLFLAPMAGYTDIPFRSLCIKHGADLTYTEMVSAEGLYRDSEKTEELMERASNERNYAVQLFMGSLDPIEKAVEKTIPYHPVMIDINAGCPVPKVTRTGSGSALMKDPELARQIVKRITELTDIPVSIKFRLGWDNQSVNFLEFADAVAIGGASAMTLHTRTRTEGYAPFAHQERLKELCDFRARHWPQVRVIASGDLFTAADVVKVLRTYEVDAVMVARGAIGNPFIFEDAKALGEGKEPMPLSTERRIQALMEHLDATIEKYGERSACHQMRKCASFYLRGMQGVREAKQAFNTTETRADYAYICARLTSIN